MGGIAVVALGTSMLLPGQGYSPVPANGTRTLSIHLYAGKTPTPFLGDTDPRKSVLIGLQYTKREPTFRYRSVRADLLQEIQFEHSSTGARNGEPANDYEGVGYLFGARHNWHLGHNIGAYADVGWGFQYNNRRTQDLQSRFNSTPFFGFGLYLPAGDHSISVGFRFFHISNAKQAGPNQGQNQLLIDVGYRF